MTAQTRRDIPTDAALGLALLVIAVAAYAGMFLHVPLLTEARDFVLRYGRDARLVDVWIPTGDDYRPFSWRFFAWQQQLFEFRSELFNLVQFVLLGLCALAGYIHLRQLFGRRVAAFGASALWLFSLPVAHAAFWQATQHDKLALLFILLALILTLHAIRFNGIVRVWILIVLTQILAALAVASKPVAFMLPVVFAAQVALFTPGRTRSDYLRAVRIVLIPAVYVIMYGLTYMHATSAAWREHTLSGNLTDNILIYIRNIANIDYDGSLTLTTVLLAPIGAAWIYALWRTSDDVRRVLIYLFVIFGASVGLLSGAAHASSFYLLLPMFAFTGAVSVLAVAFFTGSSGWIRRCAAVVIAGVVVGLLSTYAAGMAGPSRFHQWASSAQHLADGYNVIRASVDPSRVKAISFVFPKEPAGYFYFFSDGTHQVIDRTIPSFIFARPLDVSISDVHEEMPSDDSGKLVAEWSDDLQLTELRLGANAVYRSLTAPSDPLAYVPGKTISFRKGGNGKQYQGSGWSLEEDWGTWSDGAEATVLTKLDHAYHTPLEMVVRTLPFVPREHPEQAVQVLANGQRIADWTFHYGDSWAELRARIPTEAIESNFLEISFRISNPCSPQSVDISPDTRALGIMVERIRIDMTQ